MSSKTLTNLEHMNLLRTIGISIVVLRHSFGPYMKIWDIQGYDYNFIADILGRYISTISMPLFVFISGYIYCFLRNSLGKYGTYKLLAYKKARRLLVPYLFFAPIYIYFYLDYTDVVSFLSHLWTGSGHLWFLIMMFILFLIFYKPEKYLREHIKKGLVIAVTMYVMVLPLHYINMPPIALAFKYFIFFYVGYLFKDNSEVVSKFLKGKSTLLFSIHLILYFVYFFALSQTGNIIIISIINQLLLILGILSLSFIYGFLNVIFEKKPSGFIKSKSLIKYINDNSYYLYIFHQPILKSFFDLSCVQKMSPIFSISIGFVISMIFSLFISHVLMKTKIAQTLIGN